MVSIKDLEHSLSAFNQKHINFSNIDQNIIRIDTPFYDRHNDSLIIYASDCGNGNIKISDAGYVLDDLETDGIYILRSKLRMDFMLKQLNSFAIRFDKETNELYTISSTEQYAVNQYLLVQAMLFVNDMFMLSNKNVSSIFLNEVAGFLEDNNIRAIANRAIIGTSGMIHRFDFSIAGFKDIPERLIRVVNTPDNEYYAKSVAMDVHQTRKVKANAEFYTFINDENTVDNKIINLFNSENIKPVLFSKRNSVVKELAK